MYALLVNLGKPFVKRGRDDATVNPRPDLLVDTKPSSEVSGSNNPFRFGSPRRVPLCHPWLCIILAAYAYTAKYV